MHGWFLTMAFEAVAVPVCKPNLESPVKARGFIKSDCSPFVVAALQVRDLDYQK